MKPKDVERLRQIAKQDQAAGERADRPRYTYHPTYSDDIPSDEWHDDMKKTGCWVVDDKEAEFIARCFNEKDAARIAAALNKETDKPGPWTTVEECFEVIGELSGVNDYPDVPTTKENAGIMFNVSKRYSGDAISLNDLFRLAANEMNCDFGHGPEEDDIDE